MTTCCECGKPLYIGYNAILRIYKKRFAYPSPSGDKAEREVYKEESKQEDSAFECQLKAEFSVCKYIRIGQPSNTIDIAEETADVELMCEQIRAWSPEMESLINKTKQEKLDRLEKMLDD